MGAADEFVREFVKFGSCRVYNKGRRFEGGTCISNPLDYAS